MAEVGQKEGIELLKGVGSSPPSHNSVTAFIEDFVSDPVNKWWKGEVAFNAGGGDAESK